MKEDMYLLVIDRDALMKNHEFLHLTDRLSCFLSQLVRKTRLRWAMSPFCSWPTPKVTWTTGWRPSDGSYGLRLEEVKHKVIIHTLSQLVSYTLVITSLHHWICHVCSQDITEQSRCLITQRLNYKGMLLIESSNK